MKIFTVIELFGNVELWISVDGDAESNFFDVVARLLDVVLLEAAQVEERRHVLHKNNDCQRRQP